LDRSCLPDDYLVDTVQIAGNLSFDDDTFAVDVGGQATASTYGDGVLPDNDLSFQLPFNEQIFLPGEVAPDGD
jgi:hypothetical protein